MQITRKTPLSEILKIGNACIQRNRCCTFGSGSMTDKDIENLASHLKLTVEETKEKYLESITRLNTKRYRPKVQRKKGLPYGPCIFFSGKGCKIHNVKPIECKISNCGPQKNECADWFMLNYYLNPADPASVKEYAYYLKSHDIIPGGKIEEIIPDKKRRDEILEDKNGI